MAHIDEFHSEDESVEEYLERVDIYFRANDTADEKKYRFSLVCWEEKCIRYLEIS